jgi:hypothetical protein
MPPVLGPFLDAASGTAHARDPFTIREFGARDPGLAEPGTSRFVKSDRVAGGGADRPKTAPPKDGRAPRPPIRAGKCLLHGSILGCKHFLTLIQESCPESF